MAVLSLSPFQDAYISEWYAHNNFGSSVALFVSQYVQPGDDYRSLLQFNLDQIPPASTIEKAILELTVYRNEVSKPPVTLGAFRLLNCWSQYSVTWNNQPISAEAPDGRLNIPDGLPMGKVFIDVTSLVRGWHNGSIPNHGLLLKGNEQNNNLLAFRSTNFCDSNDWPLLHIDYVNGILNSFEKENLVIPKCPPCAPIEASTPVALAPRNKVTFLVRNTSDSHCVKALVQVSYSNDCNAVYFNDGLWAELKPRGYPGEAVALSTEAAAEFARVLVRGQGNEIIEVWARSYEY
ncbi:MAG: DNRLRE domain-containing protein [Syntrophomonadaceae bacterium]|jgi:hypothetical protein